MVVHLIFGLMVVAASCAFMIASQTSLHLDPTSIVQGIRPLATSDIYKGFPPDLRSKTTLGRIAETNGAAVTGKTERTDETTKASSKRPHAAKRQTSPKKRPPREFPVAVARDSGWLGGRD